MSRNASKEATLGDVSYRLEAMIDEDGVTTGSIWSPAPVNWSGT
jgi:hypothetical protein